MKNLSLLRKICKVPGAPGFEQKIRELVIKEVEPLVDELSIDAMGNVIAVKKGPKSNHSWKKGCYGGNGV